MDQKDAAPAFGEVRDCGGLAADGAEAEGGGEGAVVPREMGGLEADDLLCREGRTRRRIGNMFNKRVKGVPHEWNHRPLDPLWSWLGVGDKAGFYMSKGDNTTGEITHAEWETRCERLNERGRHELDCA